MIDIVSWATDFFKQKEIDSPRLTIELMLCSLLDIERIQVYSEFERPMNDEELGQLREMVKRRISGEPLQYILGETYFYGYRIMVDKRVLIPRPETETIIDKAREFYKQDTDLEILDIGTGSGCIAVALAGCFKNSIVTALDIDAKALKVAKKNFELNGLENFTLLEMDILKEIPEKKFDLIVSNPPYIDIAEYHKLQVEIYEHEPKIALTDETDGLTFYRRFAEILYGLMKKDGRFLIETGWDQWNAVSEIIPQNTFGINDVKDLSGNKRLVSGIVN